MKFEEMENECRRAIDMAARQYNEILVRVMLSIARQRQTALSPLSKAQETKMRVHAWKRRQTEEQLAELANTCFSDMLNEDLQKNQLRGRRNRIIFDRWKGMTEDQLDEIYRGRKAQVDQRQVRTSRCPTVRLFFFLSFVENDP